MVKKLNSMRLLEARGVRYEVLSFPDTIHSAVGVAAYYGLSPAQVYKTLVVVLSQGKPALVLIAGARSQGVSSGFSALIDPGEIGLLAREEPRDGVYQHGVGRSGMETASFFQGQDSLHPMIALGTGRAQRALAPQHAKAQGPFRAIVGRFDPMLGKKDPERIHLTEQAAGKLPCVVLPVMILVNQLAEARIPRPPLPARGWSRGHMTETLQFGECPGPTGRQVGMIPCCQTPGTADEMGQARLPRLDPVAVHAIAVTDQDACPVVNEGSKGLFRPVGMNHVEGRGVTDHHPQPLERMGEKPGRFIDVVDWGVPCLPRDREVGGLDWLGDAVQDFLDAPQADGHLQDGRTKGLHDTPSVAIGSGQFAHQGTRPGAIPRGMLGGHLGFAPASTGRTPALMQHPVRHLHRERWQL